MKIFQVKNKPKSPKEMHLGSVQKNMPRGITHVANNWINKKQINIRFA